MKPPTSIILTRYGERRPVCPVDRLHPLENVIQVRMGTIIWQYQRTRLSTRADDYITAKLCVFDVFGPKITGIGLLIPRLVLYAPAGHALIDSRYLDQTAGDFTLKSRVLAEWG